MDRRYRARSLAIGLGAAMVAVLVALGAWRVPVLRLELSGERARVRFIELGRGGEFALGWRDNASGRLRMETYSSVRGGHALKLVNLTGAPDGAGSGPGPWRVEKRDDDMVTAISGTLEPNAEYTFIHPGGQEILNQLVPPGARFRITPGRLSRLSLLFLKDLPG